MTWYVDETIVFVPAHAVSVERFLFLRKIVWVGGAGDVLEDVLFSGV